MSIENVVVVFFLGLEPHGDNVRAGATLGHGERANVLAADQLGQVLALLLVVAVATQLIDAQVGVSAVGERNRAARSAHLLHDQAMLEVAESEAAVARFFAHVYCCCCEFTCKHSNECEQFTWNCHAQQAHFAHLLPKSLSRATKQKEQLTEARVLVI